MLGAELAGLRTSPLRMDRAYAAVPAQCGGAFCHLLRADRAQGRALVRFFGGAVPVPTFEPV